MALTWVFSSCPGLGKANVNTAGGIGERFTWERKEPAWRSTRDQGRSKTKQHGDGLVRHKKERMASRPGAHVGEPFHAGEGERNGKCYRLGPMSRVQGRGAVGDVGQQREKQAWSTAYVQEKGKTRPVGLGLAWQLACRCWACGLGCWLGLRLATAWASPCTNSGQDLGQRSGP